MTDMDGAVVPTTAATMSDEEIAARVRAQIAHDMADPEWVAKMWVSLDHAASGRIIPARIALLPLPRWMFSVLFWIAPWTWGRRYRRVIGPSSSTGAKP